MIAMQFVEFRPPLTDGEATVTTSTAKELSTMRAHNNIDRRLYALVWSTGSTGAPGTTSPEDGKPAVRSGSPP